MGEQRQNVLFLCTGNSARSILAEALLDREGCGRFLAFSAGSDPKGAVHPMALEVLRDGGYPTAGLRSKSWDEFAAPGAPPIHIIVTVCDNAAAEVCPIWPGQPMTAHWGIEDPAGVKGPGQRAAFGLALRRLEKRIGCFLSLSADAGADELKRRLWEIGKMDDAKLV
jgi:arsenate reductase